MLEKFRIDKKVVIITGGAGLLGREHARAVAEIGGIPVLWDIREEAVVKAAAEIKGAAGMRINITDPDDVQRGLGEVIAKFKRADVLINNAANDPKVKAGQDQSWSRLENFSLEMWNKDLTVGLTGAFICSQVVGRYMAENGSGVILNISSDLGLIAPDQRIYRKEGLSENQQPVKPVTYSVVKHGLIGLTKYLAGYWATQNVRVNAIAPGGVYTNQPEEFVRKLTELIPMGRMAAPDEYRGAIQFLVSDASSYMTGTTLVMDGGRTLL